jgi:hypothetical protein
MVTTKAGERAMAFIKLTHKIGNAQRNVFVNVDQICRVNDSIAAAADYPTTIVLSNGQIDVCESVAEVMQLIPATSVG